MCLSQAWSERSRDSDRRGIPFWSDRAECVKYRRVTVTSCLKAAEASAPVRQDCQRKHKDLRELSKFYLQNHRPGSAGDKSVLMSQVGVAVGVNTRACLIYTLFLRLARIPLAKQASIHSPQLCSSFQMSFIFILFLIINNRFVYDIKMWSKKYRL